MDVCCCCGGGWEKRAVASELARMLDMVREALLGQDLPAATRKILGDLASSVERSVRIVESCGWAGHSPGFGDGSPPRTEAAPAAAGGKIKAVERPVRILESWPGSGDGSPPRTEELKAQSSRRTQALGDGATWRKYGQKYITGAKHTRAYFRCTHRHSQGCLATKHVQRTDGDPLLYDVVYTAEHACAEFATKNVQRTDGDPLLFNVGTHAGQQSLPPLAPESVQAGLEPMAFAGTDALPPLAPESVQAGLEPMAFAGTDADMEFQIQIEEFFNDFNWDL